MTTVRVLAVAVVVALLLAGPLAPHALAQQPAQPMQPAPAQPDLFQETLKAQRAAERRDGVYDAGAIVVNAFLVPGRAITCLLGGAVGIGVLALTFGTGYRTAAGAVQEGCGGKWVVTSDDLRPDPGAVRPFDWERN